MYLVERTKEIERAGIRGTGWFYLIVSLSMMIYFIPWRGIYYFIMNNYYGIKIRINYERYAWYVGREKAKATFNYLREKARNETTKKT